MFSSTLVLAVVVVAYLVAGTSQTVSLKWTDKLAAPDRFAHDMVGSTPRLDEQAAVPHLYTDLRVALVYSFAHPFSQAFFMFCSEALCLVLFAAVLLYKCCCVAHARIVRGVDVSLPCNPCVWMLTSGADLLGSIIQNVGMTLTSASVFQMLRGATVVWVVLISYLWLHRRFLKVEYWGMGLVVVGLTCVGLSSFVGNGGGGDDYAGDGADGGAARSAAAAHEASLQTLGNLLVISAQVLHAYQAVCSERLVHLYKIPPLQMVGIEGLYGVSMTVILLALLQLMPLVAWGHNLVAIRVSSSSFAYDAASGRGAGRQTVPFAAPAVVQYSNVSWLLPSVATASDAATTVNARVPYDDLILAFDQLRQAASCRAAILIYIASGLLYNATQMYIIKHLSAAATVMIGSLRNVSVWVVCLFMPAIFGEHFNIVQFIGFVFLLVGNVLFQRVWIHHFDELLPVSVIDACPWLFRDTVEVPLVTASAGHTSECDNGISTLSSSMQTKSQLVSISQGQSSVLLVKAQEGM